MSLDTGGPLQRLPSIRSKLGSIIIVAVGVTLALVYFLLSIALRNDFREVDLVRLLEIAQDNSRDTEYDAPAEVSLARLGPDGAFVWFGPELPEPPRYSSGVHVGIVGGVAYAAVPLRTPRDEPNPQPVDGMLYALRLEPGFVTSSARFLLLYWSQLALAGAIGAGIAIGLARWLGRGMTRPLRDMAEAARAMETGDYAQRVKTDSRDEVGKLATAFNRMAEELGTLDALRRDLVANVSHELRTPISALRAHLENLLDGVEMPDPATLEVMLGQSERLGRLVDQLLDLARLESGEAPFRREPLAVDGLVDRVLSEIGVASADRDLALVREVPVGLPQMEADVERLHQVLYNLLDNAVRFTPRGGTITVRASESEGRMRFEVEDTGPGIPEDHRARVFDRFYRVDPSRSREDGGTGIGLAIARSVVEGHGGRIWVEPGSVGGSRFVVDLPLRAGAPAVTR